MGKVQTVGTLEYFIANGKVGANSAPPAPDFGWLDWFIHPMEHIKETGKEALYAKLEPFLDLICAVSTPIATMTITVASLLYIVGMKDKSITAITRTSIIYVLIQALPLFVKACIAIM